MTDYRAHHHQVSTLPVGPYECQPGCPYHIRPYRDLFFSAVVVVVCMAGAGLIIAWWLIR